jgi:RNA polymerase II-associated factor 1
MESDGDHFLAYYLTKDDASALAFKKGRALSSSSPSDDTQQLPISTAFHFVRDYETVKIEQEVQNEFLLVLDDGDRGVGEGSQVGEEGADIGRREKGAYYKDIERKMTLKKKRVNVRPWLNPLSSCL